ncbi:DUF445 domain-containing protein [Blautia producta]|uniref:DUF445 family protein n=1 Tax=Blautia producta TaxID=33035 RepID=A0A4P6M0I1_9FIRM|nr:DUF445 family protein [Blautia producta]QBE97575.1 hypothetical protein PMF13cell1_03138 [Blautia producta]
MNFLRLLAGPLIGAVIGYCTNYIAVKMLFRPLYPVKIGNWTLPFTPGIIPRGKSRLAKALGSAVGDHLITKTDLEDMLLSEGVKNTIVSRISEGVQKVQKSDDTVECFLQHYVEQGDYEAMREKLEDFITDRITEGLDKLDVGSIIAEEGAKEVKQKFQGSMVSMFLTDDLINSIAEPIGRKVGDYIRENGHDKIHPVVVGEIASVESRKVGELIESIPLGEEKIRALVESIYVKFVGDKAGELAEQFHIAKVVEEKVNGMDVLEVENILMSIMKKELNAVINLGALIGFIIGLLNLLL